jgi:hypothetical protein
MQIIIAQLYSQQTLKQNTNEELENILRWEDDGGQIVILNSTRLLLLNEYHL